MDCDSRACGASFIHSFGGGAMKEHNREVRGRAEQKQIPLLPSLALRAAVGMTNFVGQRLDAAVAQPEVQGSFDCGSGHRQKSASPAASSELRCVMGEDKVAGFGRFVAGKAGFVQRLVARLAVLKVTESPAP
jgi:hypothetical protein